MNKATIKEIRKDLKAKYPECKFSVTSGKSVNIYVNLMEAPFEAMENNSNGHCVCFTKEELKKETTEKAYEIMFNAMMIASSHDGFYVVTLGIGKEYVPFKVVTKEEKAKSKTKRATTKRSERYAEYDKIGTKLESNRTSLFVNGQKVIKGYESYTGWYWFAVKVDHVQDSVIDGIVYENDIIYYGYVQGLEYEWGYFSKAELERNKYRTWSISMRNLPHSGRRGGHKSNHDNNAIANTVTPDYESARAEMRAV